MKVIVDFCVIPLGVGLSLSNHIAACHNIFREAELKTKLHAYGTNIEGEWDEVMESIKRCHEVLHDMGTPRISTQLKIGTRTDTQQTLEQKISSVEQKLS